MTITVNTCIFRFHFHRIYHLLRENENKRLSRAFRILTNQRLRICDWPPITRIIELLWY